MYYERLGICFSQYSIDDFNVFINEYILGCAYGWACFHMHYNISLNGTKLNKLHMQLASKEVLDTFLNISSQALESWVSDLVHVVYVVANFSHIPFKLFNSWMQVHRFDQVIKDG